MDPRGAGSCFGKAIPTKPQPRNDEDGDDARAAPNEDIPILPAQSLVFGLIPQHSAGR